MFVKRATEEYGEYCNPDCFLKRLSYIGLEGQSLRAVLEFSFINPFEVEIINFNNLDNKRNRIISLFIDKFLYWNPFVKYIHYKKKKWKNKKPSKLFSLPVLDILVEQLSISRKKYEDALKWIQNEDDVIICVVKIDNRYVCIDGYSRLLVAYQKGFSNVLCYLEDDDYDEEPIREFLKWCREEKIETIKDLETKVISDKEHLDKWVARCQNYLTNRNNHEIEQRF